MPDYTPIDCDFYDHLEDAATRKVPLFLTYTDDGGERRTVTAQIVDLYTAEGAEYLAARPTEGDGQGELIQLRLDQLVTLVPTA